MHVPRMIGLVAAFGALAACSETTTEPQPLDSDVVAAASARDHDVTIVRSRDGNILVASGDPATGLVAVHYTSAALYTGFVGCPVPPFESEVDVKTATYPSGSTRAQWSGTMYVRVFDLAGFPANVFSCSDPVAQGPIEVHAVQYNPPSSGESRMSSHGTITKVADGRKIRLFHEASLTGALPEPATIRLYRDDKDDKGREHDGHHD
jgi:hypothetical protein